MSWEQLKNIKAQAIADSKKPEVKVPEMCPVDGTRLNVNSKGIRDCPLGNFRWP